MDRCFARSRKCASCVNKGGRLKWRSTKRCTKLVGASERSLVASEWRVERARDLSGKYLQLSQFFAKLVSGVSCCTLQMLARVLDSVQLEKDADRLCATSGFGENEA